MMSNPPIDDAPRRLDFPFTEWQTGIEDAANRLTGRIRHCARSAFAHLRKSWTLHGTDDEMSAFRAITAEEEAATALMWALKRQRYPGADRLRPWSHSDKNGFWPVIMAVNNVLAKTGMPPPNITLTRKGRPKMTLRINLTAWAGEAGEPMWVEPDQPLNFSVRTGQASDLVIHLFEEELAELANTKGQKSILTHIQSEANMRNRLLYASDGGIPNVSFHDDMLIERGRRVGVILALTIIVAQTSLHQLFVTQCLEALLRALATIRDEVFEYPDIDAPVEGQRLMIERLDGQPARFSTTRVIDVGLVWGMAGSQWQWGKPHNVVVFFRDNNS